MEEHIPVLPPLSIATSSLNPFPASSGPPHDLLSKLNAIAYAGFAGIELAFPDLLSFATSHSGHKIDPQEWEPLCDAAKEVRRHCETLGVKIMMLQPFGNFEGWNADTEEGRSKKEDAIWRAEGWIRIMKELGTDMLQVGSTDALHIKTDKNTLAADLAQLADMLSAHSMRLAYENWCWSTVAPTWRDVFEIITHTAGGEWGDPTTETGHIEGLTESELKDKYTNSLNQLTATIPPENIYLLQVSDAYRPPRPWSPGPDKDGLRPKARWSSSFRPMPGAIGGYLPIREMAAAVKDTGFRSWFSIEIFDGGPEGNRRSLQDLNKEVVDIMFKTQHFVKEVMAEDW